MTTHHEVMRQALDALEYANTGNRRPEIIGPVIQALRTALAQQGEPCDMGQMCLNCQPRGPNGECPDKAAPAPQAQPLTLVSSYTADLDAARRESKQKSAEWLKRHGIGEKQ